MSETATETVTPADVAANAPESDASEPTTFDADYVKGLRDEAAQRRTEAKSASERGDALYEQLLTRTIEAATSGVLYDATDLPRDGDYLGDDGFPNVDKIRTAAEELAARKPYLSRPSGDVTQGARQQPAPQESLGALIRKGL